jgi:hypothetical protein
MWLDLYIGKTHISMEDALMSSRMLKLGVLSSTYLRPRGATRPTERMTAVRTVNLVTTLVAVYHDIAGRAWSTILQLPLQCLVHIRCFRVAQYLLLHID